MSAPLRTAAVLALCLAGACDRNDAIADRDAGAPPRDAAVDIDDGGAALPDAACDACASDGGDLDGGARPDGSTEPDAAEPDAACCDAGMPPLDVADLVEHGEAASSQLARPSYGGLLAASDGERSYVVESRRDVEPGPFNLPWRSRFRLAAYEAGEELWSFAAQPDDLIADVVVHRSGELTIALQRHAPQADAYDLVRLTRDGEVISTTTLHEPQTLPDTDFGPNDARPLFRMKAMFPDATNAGWLRLLPSDEGLVVAVLSYVQPGPDEPVTNRLALALLRLDWRAQAYAERWARIVDGTHVADPAAWSYDELRWRDQAIRPFLARDEHDGRLYVGRAWNQARCQAHRETFGGFTAEDCVLRAINVVENERLPLAVTPFTPSGERLETLVIAPDTDAAEQVPFALAARDGRLAVVGAIVRTVEGGAQRTYPNPSGFVDYDGYVSIHAADGARLAQHDFNLGRGDMLAALRWLPAGILAVGSSGWDRWQGGMSISRGCDPVFAWLSSDGAAANARVIPLSAGKRHYNLHDLVVDHEGVVAYGFADAPMTHSADGDKHEARTFGALRVALTPPSTTD